MTTSEAERHLAALIEAEPECVKTLGRDGTVLSMNPAGLSMLEADCPTQVLGRRVFEVIAPEHREAFVRYHQRVCAGERGVIEFDIIGFKGTRRNMETTSAPLATPDGIVHLAVTRDISERKRAFEAQRQLQASLAHADRMASIGTLAAGVAHEINNPLSYVLANLQFALAEITGLTDERAARIRGALEEAQQGGERISAIVGDLMTFARPDERTSGAVRVSQAVESAITIAWNELRHRARLSRRFADDPYVPGNPAQLGQVFLNLLINAAQAIPAGAADHHEVTVAIRIEDGRAVIEVGDTGVGISRADAGRIFDPFVTTKPIGSGTGLGLWICRRIVTGLGGTIELVDRPGPGSTFRVCLPAVAPAPPPIRIPTPPPVRRARLAVIDDEPLVARALQRLLADDHEVVVFESAGEAIAWFERGETCDVVICDLMMPEVTGMEMHAWLEAHRPALAGRTIYLTGGAFTEAAVEFVQAPDRRCLDKPIDLDRLGRAIDALLSA